MDRNIICYSFMDRSHDGGYGFGEILISDKRESLVLYYWANHLLFIYRNRKYRCGSNENPMLLYVKLLIKRNIPHRNSNLMMTLGPLIALIPWAEKARGAVVDFFSVFGKVPFSIPRHILIIHISALIANYSCLVMLTGMVYHCAVCTVPPESKWSLGLLYFVFVSMSLFCTSFQSGIRNES